MRRQLRSSSQRQQRIVLWNRGAERCSTIPPTVLGRSFVLPPEGKGGIAGAVRAPSAARPFATWSSGACAGWFRIDVRMTAARCTTSTARCATSPGPRGHHRSQASRNAAAARSLRPADRPAQSAHAAEGAGACSRATPAVGRLPSLFDLDGFKDVNDTLCHSTGDELLIEVGQRLSTRRRAAARYQCADSAERVRGDHPRCGNPRVVGDIVQSILKRLAKLSTSTTTPPHRRQRRRRHRAQ